MFVVMLQKCKSFLKTAAFYALVEKKNWAWCHLKTNWLMRRQLVKSGNFEKYIHFWSIPTNVLALFVFFRAIANWCIIQSGEKNVKNWHFLLNLDGLLFWMKNFFVFLFNASQFQSHKDQCRLFVFQSVLQGYQPAKSPCVLNHRLDTLQ